MKKLVNMLMTANVETLNMTLNNVHAKGMFSLVFGGTEFGFLTRAFLAKKKLKPFSVQLHIRRYPIRITVIKGEVTHYTAKEVKAHKSGCVTLSRFNYKSPLNGGSELTYEGESLVKISSNILPVGSCVFLGCDDFHTISCSKGSIWIVEEMGFVRDSSKVLGVPFISDNLYTKPEMFQINDNAQMLKTEINKILSHYRYQTNQK